MSKAKILFVITKATWGGAQKYVYDLAMNLPKEQFSAQGGPASGWEAVVAYGEKGKLTEMLEKVGIHTYQISSLGRDVALLSDIQSFFQMMRCIRAIRPDVVHLNSSKAAALGALAARMCGIKKIIFTVHGWPFNEKRNATTSALIYWVSWFTALLSHDVIVVSTSDEAQGKRMWLVGKKIHYIPIGITSIVFCSREESLTSLSIPRSDTVRIVTIAELTKNKGITYAIDAITELKKRSFACEYFVIGDGELRGALEKQAREFDVADRVHFLGFVHDASRYLSAFDIFLLPSIKEGMPYVLIEAGNTGMPVIATTAVNPDLKERYPRMEFIAPAKAQSIAAAIQQLDEYDTETEKAKNMFPLKDMVEKTTALY